VKVLGGDFHPVVLSAKARIELPPAVKPKSRLKRLENGDAAFEDDVDVMSKMQRGVNIAGMDPGDFEHLVNQTFVRYADKMLGCKPGDVTVGKVTKVGTAAHQGDRGIDCVIQDLRPVVGQKIVVQAKCYTATVPVEAVRAFHTSIMQHKANKGILVTTTTFGPESRKVAEEFGIVELMTGAELVGLMKELEIPGYCDPQEVRDNGEHTLEARKARKQTVQTAAGADAASAATTTLPNVSSQLGSTSSLSQKSKHPTSATAGRATQKRARTASNDSDDEDGPSVCVWSRRQGLRASAQDKRIGLIHRMTRTSENPFRTLTRSRCQP
jgi:hypothetical protein